MDENSKDILNSLAFIKERMLGKDDIRMSFAKSHGNVRSVRDKKIHVICSDGSFDTLPDDIRKLGPRQSLSHGDIERLKAHYRLQLAEQGFVVVHQPMGTFSPDHA